jgi:hypothetical protein
MNSSKLLLTAISLIIAPSISFAFFCPTNFNQIDFGMTIDQVTQICGKPNSQTESKKQNENIPQEWTYYIPQTVDMGGTNQQAQGTLKTSVSFNDKGNAINISVNGIGVGETMICGSNVHLGDSRDSVKAACGKPSSINKQTSDETTQQKDAKITEFHYLSTNAPTILIFENGKLTEKK